MLKEKKGLYTLPEAWQIPGYTRLFFGGTPTAILPRKAGSQDSDTCPFCGGVHVHGAAPGHRLPHCASGKFNSSLACTDGTVLYQKSGYVIADYAEPDDSCLKVAGYILKDLGELYPDTLRFALQQPVSNILSNLSFWLKNLNEISAEAMFNRYGTGFYLGVMLYTVDANMPAKFKRLHDYLVKVNPLFKMRLPDFTTLLAEMNWEETTPGSLIEKYSLPNNIAA